MEPEDVPEDAPAGDAGEVDDEADSGPPMGVWRAIGELLAAVLVVAAVLGALLIGALGVQWIFG